MSNREHAYFQQRAEVELQLAQQADHPAAVKAHSELAGRYLDRLNSSEHNGMNAAGRTAGKQLGR